MIDLVNTSPNMGTFCHRERNLEFPSWKIWIWTICLTRHFTLFKTFPFGLLLVLGSGRILGILSSFAISGRVGGMVVCGSEPAGQRLSIEGELAVIQEPALAQTARPIHIWYIYYWDHAPQYIIDTTHHTSARNLLAQYFCLEDPMDITRITSDKAWCIGGKGQRFSPLLSCKGCNTPISRTNGKYLKHLIQRRCVWNLLKKDFEYMWWSWWCIYLTLQHIRFFLLFKNVSVLLFIDDISCDLKEKCLRPIGVTWYSLWWKQTACHVLCLKSTMICKIYVEVGDL